MSANKPPIQNDALFLTDWSSPDNAISYSWQREAGIDITGIVSAQLSEDAATLLWLKRVAVEGVSVGGEDVRSYVARRSTGEHSQAWIEDQIQRTIAGAASSIRQQGQSPTTLGIEGIPRGLDAGQDAIIVHPETGLFGIAGARETINVSGSAGVTRFVAGRFQSHVAQKEGKWLGDHPELDTQQNLLRRAMAQTKLDLHNALHREVYLQASSMLLAGLIGEDALTVLNAGSSTAYLINHDSGDYVQLVTKQAVGPAGRRSVQHLAREDTNITAKRLPKPRDDTTEIISYSWDELLDRGERATIAFASVGITGDLGLEVVEPVELAKVIHRRRANLKEAAHAVATETAQRVGGRSLVLVGIHRS